jgi:hypothetical protein
MDGVLESLEQRFKLVDPLLQDFNALLMSLSRRSGGHVRGPTAASQLNDTAENRHATQRPPAWISATRHGRNLLLPLCRTPREGRRKQDPTSGTGRIGRLVPKTTGALSCAQVGLGRRSLRWTTESKFSVWFSQLAHRQLDEVRFRQRRSSRSVGLTNLASAR